MSSPSGILAAIRSKVDEGLDSIVDVRAMDHLPEIADLETLPKGATVIISALGGNLVDVDQPPSLVDSAWAAFCFARFSDKENALTRGSVAMDLAHRVAAIVDRNRWDSSVTRAATRLRVTNESSRAWAAKGLTVWTVAWTQQIELTQNVPDEINRLAIINFTLDQVGNRDEQARIVFPDPQETP